MLTTAISVAAACKDDEKKEALGDPEFPPGWTPPSLDQPEAGAPKRAAANTEGWLVVDPGAERPELVSQAVAHLRPTEGSRVEGTMWFGATSEGLRVKVDFKELTFMGKFALRVHVMGDCSAPDGMSAGPSFAFEGSSFHPDNGPNTGLLGEITADISGNAKGETLVTLASLQGPFSIIGRALVIHGRPETVTKSPDPFGPRLACGVIGILGNLGGPPPGPPLAQPTPGQP